MKLQGTIKLLTGGVTIGLALLLASVASGAAQISPAAPDGVRKVLNPPAQTNSATPAANQPAPSKPIPIKASPAQPVVAKPVPAKAVPIKPKQAIPAATTQSKTAQAKPVARQARAVTPQAQFQTPPPAARVLGNPGPPQLKTVAEHSISRRDPFDPLVGKDKGPSGPQAPLPAGKPGLVIATLRVDGIVRSPSGMIAVVSNPQMRVYFLHEGDRLYDGEVQHITMEGVSFHETGKDAFGKSVARESTKRLYPKPGEQQ